MQQQISAYQQSQVMTAKPGDILLALYDGAIRFVGLAEAAIAARDYAAKAVAINRANAILGELTSTLDSKVGPDVCAQLAALYGYFIDRVNTASVKMQVEPLQEVTAHLARLRVTWEQAVRQARTQGLRV